MSSNLSHTRDRNISTVKISDQLSDDFERDTPEPLYNRVEKFRKHLEEKDDEFVSGLFTQALRLNGGAVGDDVDIVTGILLDTNGRAVESKVWTLGPDESNRDEIKDHWDILIEVEARAVLQISDFRTAALGETGDILGHLQEPGKSVNT